MLAQESYITSLKHGMMSAEDRAIAGIGFCGITADPGPDASRNVKIAM